ncbi:MAG: SAM-dependent methyltransferase [Pseudomonadota bacterium]
MTGFSAEWLRLREAADDRARDAALMIDTVGIAAAPDARITDLGGGSGATMRVLGPHLPAAYWRILDHDPALLALIETGPKITTEVTDLAAAPEAAIAGGPTLITASAFFDLVSIEWLERFTALLAEAQIPLYAALTYDGREDWHPRSEFEEHALMAFHNDMRRDKGFGRALGPGAAGCLQKMLTSAGFEVKTAPSDWRLERHRDSAMMDALAAGGAEALRSALPAQRHATWAADRMAAQSVMVGHTDILAVPKGR